MAQDVSLPKLLDAKLQSLVDAQSREFAPLGPDAQSLTMHAASFLSGGKRLRAEFLAAGYRSVHRCPISTTFPTCVLEAAAALELFHAAALAHDDVIDRSDTRRGAPSSHRHFEAQHRSLGWASDAEHFGESSAIIFGDLLLVWSDECFIEATLAADSPVAGRRAREEFRRMRAEVAAGQYLDLVEEVAWPTVPVAELDTRARRVATAKSARYSVESPLVLGALLAGADDEHVERIRAFGLPLGLAFQFRDDILGVTGDSAVTGKPAGDDLREGKRTVLIAHAMEASDAEGRAWFEARLGHPGLSDAEVHEMINKLETLGAFEYVEREIERLLSEAHEKLEAAELDEQSHELLMRLAERTARRHV